MDAMAVRSPEIIQVTGTQPTYHTAEAGGDKIAKTGDNVVLHVRNGSAGSITATIVTPGTVAGQDIGDISQAMAAGEEWFFGPFPYRHFANADGQVDLTWSSTDPALDFAVVAV